MDRSEATLDVEGELVREQDVDQGRSVEVELLVDRGAEPLDFDISAELHFCLRGSVGRRGGQCPARPTQRRCTGLIG